MAANVYYQTTAMRNFNWEVYRFSEGINHTLHNVSVTILYVDEFVTNVTPLYKQYNPTRIDRIVVWARFCRNRSVQDVLSFIIKSRKPSFVALIHFEARKKGHMVSVLCVLVMFWMILTMHDVEG